MNTNLQTIFEQQEWEDWHMLRYHMETVIRQEYAEAERISAAVGSSRIMISVRLR